jgi:2',3'-cyclic-nucleotide 2'-phosphodiesterase/3'-nucleotidase
MLFKRYIQKKHLSLSLLIYTFIAFTTVAFAKENEPSNSDEIVRLRVIGFSDLHGNFLTYDHLQKRPAQGGLPWIYSFVKQERRDTTQHIVLLNSGDFLQGSVAVYYYNYIDRREDYMPFVFLRKAGVDASVFGNHDLEPGSMVIRRAQRTSVMLNTEIIAANVFSSGTRMRAFKPYVILERGGLRIAVLGLTTPLLTGCARTQIVTGMDVADMYSHARNWVNYITTSESPDLIIGLFHAGIIDKSNTDPATEQCLDVNDPMYIARHVPGFDGFILGHQHKLVVDSIYMAEDPWESNRSNGLIDSIHIGEHPVWLIEPGFGGIHVGILDFKIKKIPGERARILYTSAKIENVSNKPLPQDIKDEFAEEEELVATAADRVIAVVEDKPQPSVSSDGAYFGSNFFVDIVHKVQLDTMRINRILGPGDTVRENYIADVSFASPLSTNITFTPGDSITFGDLLRIYRFENKLVLFRMTGQEIKDYLEYSYGLWINQMHSPSDELLRLTPEGSTFLFEIPAFNYDSGGGLDYEVDVTKPPGERLTIFRMWNDKPFHLDSTFVVAANSYRFSGAGGHLELGAKIKPEELANRLVWLYDVQVRELIRRNFVREGEVRLFQFNNWRFVPSELVDPAKERELQEIQRRRRR